MANAFKMEKKAVEYAAVCINFYTFVVCYLSLWAESENRSLNIREMIFLFYNSSKRFRQ